jgi:ferredoxin
VIKVDIDLTRCQGYGNCLTPSGGILDINDDGQAFVTTDSVPDEKLAEMNTAASMCPVSAIKVSQI